MVWWCSTVINKLNRTTFRGVGANIPTPHSWENDMRPGWQKRIDEAQKIDTYNMGGEEYPRIKYGDESDDWGADHQPCHDCAVKKGQFHVPGCDVERCPKCGGQAISCDCDNV